MSDPQAFAGTGRTGRTRALARRRVRALTRRSLRARRATAAAVLVLAAVAIALAAFGPLYLRMVQTAQLRETLGSARTEQRGISLGRHVTDAQRRLIPSDLFRAPVSGLSVGVSFVRGDKPIESSVFSRGDSCRHVRVIAGRCPAAAREVAASPAAAKLVGLRVGDEFAPAVLPGSDNEGRVGRLRLVGLVVHTDDPDYWFGRAPDTASGGVVVSERGGRSFSIDPLLTDLSTFAVMKAAYRSRLPIGGTEFVADSVEDYALRPAPRLDDVGRLRKAVATLQARIDPDPTAGYTVTSDLRRLLDTAATGARQARSVVVVLTVEAALLVLVVLVVMVVVSTDRRQGELALVRLRGWSSGRLVALVVGEYAVLTALAVPVAAALVYGAGRLADRFALGGRAGVPFSWPDAVTAAATAAVVVAAAAVVARRTARQPVQEMLRRVPPRTGRRGVGAFEAVVGIAVVAAVGEAVSGGRSGMFALLLPALLGLAAGLLLGRVVTAVATAIGARSLWRGQVALGLSCLQIARRPGSRRTVALVCVAAALAVTAPVLRQIAADNRLARGRMEAGAPVSLAVTAASPSALRDAVDAVDPSGENLAAVVVQTPPSGDPVVAVDPDRLRDVGGWPAGHRPAASALAALDPARPAPIEFTGRLLQVQLHDTKVLRTSPSDGLSRPEPLYLLVDLRQSDGTATRLRVGPIPETDPVATFRAETPCTSTCRLVRLTVGRAQGDLSDIDLNTTIALAATGSDGRSTAVDLRAASDWAGVPNGQVDEDGNPDSIGLTAQNGTLIAKVALTGSAVSTQHRSVPVTVPAMTVGGYHRPAGKDAVIAAPGVDGLEARYRPVGSLPYVPMVAGPVLLVDLDLALADASASGDGAVYSVWSARADPTAIRSVSDRLKTHGVTVFDQVSTRSRVAALGRSAPAWALQLAVGSAAASLLLGVVAMLVVSGAAASSRAADRRSLRHAGVASRVVVRGTIAEHVVPTLLAAACGAVAGVAGARLVVAGLPLFLTSRVSPPPDYRVPWVPTLVIAGTVVVVLVVVAAGIGVRAGVRGARGQGGAS